MNPNTYSSADSSSVMASLGHVRGGEVGSPVSGGGAEDGLEAFFNTLDDLVFVLDAEGRILFTAV